MKREWTTKEKSEWGEGPWQTEPDKVQWVDEATGLDCLIVRNRGGALCGYVGVPESHPLFGVGYSEEVAGLGAALEARKEQPVNLGSARDNPGMSVMIAMLSGEIKASPDIVFTVHGGLTFADACDEPTREQFDGIPKRIAERLGDAAKYPKGDAASDVRELREQAAMTFEQWSEHQMARRICHAPEPGRPRKVWWFGFDCAHAGDHSPAHESMMARLLPDYERVSYRDHDVYRDRAYAEGEVTRLAAQLAEIRPTQPEQQPAPVTSATAL